MAQNADRLVDYVIKNASKLNPDKISALGDVIEALGGEIEQAPNAVPDNDNDPDLLDPKPINIADVTGVQIDDGPRRSVKVYGGN